MVPLFALFYFQSANSEEFCSKKAEGGMGKDRLNPVFQLAFIILAFLVAYSISILKEVLS